MSTSVEPRGWAKAALHANGWFVYMFFYAPIVLLVIYSFSNSRNVGTWGGFTLDWYSDFFDSSNASSPTSPDSISSSELAPLCDDPEEVSVLKIPSIKALVVESDDSKPFVFQTK